MAGPSKKMRVSDEVVLHEMLHSDISEGVYSSESEINVKIYSCGEQSVRSNEEENVSDGSCMQHGIWAKPGAERPHFYWQAWHKC
jgi:hypothetical protein